MASEKNGSEIGSHEDTTFMNIFTYFAFFDVQLELYITVNLLIKQYLLSPISLYSLALCGNQ